MWRVGVLVVLSVVFVSEAAEQRYGPQLQRLKRSPHYDCPPYGGGGPPGFWPPPPRHHHFGPPPYWPPPPSQEDFNQEQGSQAQSSAKSGALTQQPGGQDGSNQGGPGKERGPNHQGGPSQGTGPGQDGGQYQGNQPCDTCRGRGQESAVSNAKSDSGSAVAIAISGKNGGK